MPADRGAMIIHISDKFTVLLGVEAEINANGGTIAKLDQAVS